MARKKGGDKVEELKKCSNCDNHRKASKCPLYDQRLPLVLKTFQEDVRIRGFCIAWYPKEVPDVPLETEVRKVI